MGVGTALVYPTLLAAVSDIAHPEWRGSAVGVYRLWRDGGYAVGALLSGLLADDLGLSYPCYRWCERAVRSRGGQGNGWYSTRSPTGCGLSGHDP
jgi:MFS family permease